MLHDLDVLNTRFAGDARAAISFATSGALGEIALVSSFGAESVVLLHLVSQVAPKTPVLFIDTLMLFPETLAYQRKLAAQLPLTDIRVIQPDAATLRAEDPADDLHQSLPDTCCDVRKTQPLAQALSGFSGWITGRKRVQGGQRAKIDLFEFDSVQGQIKINPLANWDRDTLAAYIDVYDLPRHPLVAKGFPSIGCAPCTSPAGAEEDPRAGRWRGLDKTECGIHIDAGRIIRKFAS